MLWLEFRLLLKCSMMKQMRDSHLPLKRSKDGYTIDSFAICETCDEVGLNLWSVHESLTRDEDSIQTETSSSMNCTCYDLFRNSSPKEVGISANCPWIKGVILGTIHNS